ncbi:MAG: YceI family protein [Agarilytica sp.]
MIKPKLKQDLVDIRPGEYQLDPKHSSLHFNIDHMGFSRFVGRFNRFDAQLSWNPKDVEASSLMAVIAMDSVDVNNEKFARALKGKFWFNAEAFPQAVFETVSAKKISDRELLFTGNLSFLGITKSIDLNVRINGAANNLISGKYTLGFSAEGRFLRSDFGLDRHVPAVGDEVQLDVQAEFQKN